MTLSWLAPAAVWKDSTVATGMPGGKAAACRPLVERTSPLFSGVWGGTRSSVRSLPGPCPSTMPVSWLPPNVTPTFDWPSVMSWTTQE